MWFNACKGSYEVVAEPPPSPAKKTSKLLELPPNRRRNPNRRASMSDRKQLPCQLFLNAAESAAARMKKSDVSTEPSSSPAKSNPNPWTEPAMNEEDLCKFDSKTCPPGVKLANGASVQVYRSKLGLAAEQDPVGAFAECLLHEYCDLREHGFPPGQEWPRYDCWKDMLEILGEGVKAEHLGEDMQKVMKKYPHPSFTMNFCDNQKSRIKIAFAREYAYWFCLNRLPTI
eukprot:gb/GEZN01014293.1/.p1 GENE.gb/GEZN01014293.1/~~gb/GEZN01014293.1/.p1  ORF type:complete len:229 (-),score=37.54 gb/GEZN01014293.1/:242-928(-)